MSKTILAIDPGNVKSAYILLNGTEILESGYLDTEEMKDKIIEGWYDILAVEGIKSRGNKMGPTTVKTAENAGVFYGIAYGRYLPTEIIYRDKINDNGIKSIRSYLCGVNNAKTSEVNTVVKKMFPGCWLTGKVRGVLWMDNSADHKLSAAAVALTYQGSEQYQKECMK